MARVKGSRVLQAMEVDVALDPVQVGLLGANAVVACADCAADLIEQFLRGPGRIGGHYGLHCSG